jgi:hypothetical protein
LVSAAETEVEERIREDEQFEEAWRLVISIIARDGICVLFFEKKSKGRLRT